MLRTNDPTGIFLQKILGLGLFHSKSSAFLVSHNSTSLGLFCVGPPSATVAATLCFTDCVCQEGDRKF